MANASPAKFIREVKQETSKVTWPTRKETIATTGIVLLMTLIAAVFFLSVDWLVRLALQVILGL